MFNDIARRLPDESTNSKVGSLRKKKKEQDDKKGNEIGYCNC